MANAPTRTDKAGGCYVYHWSLTTANPTGDAVEHPGAPDKTHQALGVFGAGTLKWEGSLDAGTTWFQLHDPTNVGIALTAAGGGAILENPLQIRPNLSGSAGAAVEAYLLVRSAK